MEKLVDDIKNFFQDFQVTINDLHNPSYIFVRDFYIRALLELEVDDESVRKVQLSQMQNLDPDEIDIIPEINLAAVIRNAFPFISFGLLHLLNPEPKSTLQHFRKVMDFLLFAENRITVLNPYLDEHQDQKKILDNLNAKRNMLAQKCNESAVIYSELTQSLDNMKRSNHKLDTQLQKMSERLDKLTVKKIDAEKILQQNLQQLGLKEKQIEETNFMNSEQAKLEEMKQQLFELYDSKQKMLTKMNELGNKKTKVMDDLRLANEKLISWAEVVKNYRKERCDEMEWERLLNTKNSLKQIQDSSVNDVMLEEEKKADLLGKIEQEEAKTKKSLEDEKQIYSDVMDKFKKTKILTAKLYDVNNTIEGVKKTALPIQDQYIELTKFCDTKEAEFEEFTKKFFSDLKKREQIIRDRFNNPKM